jgi:RND family efflux transporter MFP subunit
MRTANSTYIMSTCCLLVALLLSPSVARAIDLEGFVEPYQTVNVAVDETGTIEEVFVREGELIEQGQPLIKLSSEVHEALLAIAEQSMQATGRLAAAQADLQMRQLRLSKLETLRAEGHARQEEVDRATGEVAVAEANLRTAQEDLMSRRLEYEKIKAQLDRRTVRAPISGAISMLHKVAGEFVAPNDPEILTLVQLDTLLANFTLMSTQLDQLKVNQKLKVYFLQSNTETTGVVEFVSPVTDAESGTVLVKVRIDNRAGRFRSGERCTIRIGS